MIVERRTYQLPEVNRREVLRYAKAQGSSDQATIDCMERAIVEITPLLAPRLCFIRAELELTPPNVAFGGLRVSSNDLCKALKNCTEAIAFAGTLGLDVDRVIAKHSRLSPVTALFCQAIGAERIEALCDAFCDDVRSTNPQMFLKPRFSPGFGDLTLDFQKALTEALDTTRLIGMSLNGSFLMSPSKSVTAIMGLMPCQSTN